MFSRPPSPSTVTSTYEDTFKVHQGDDLDPGTKEDLNNAAKGLTDEQYATYQCHFQSMNKSSNDIEPGPLNKVKGKQAQWQDRQIPGVPQEELNLGQQQCLLDDYKHVKINQDLPAEKDSGFDWNSQHLNGDEKFSRKRQQEELDRIEASRFENIPEQRAILESFKEPPKITSTPKEVDRSLLEQIAAM